MALSYVDESIEEEVWISVRKNGDQIGVITSPDPNVACAFYPKVICLTESDLLELWTKVSILNKDFYDD